MDQQHAIRAYEAGRVPQGHYIVCDPMGRVVEIREHVYSFAAITYQATRAGLVRVH